MGVTGNHSTMLGNVLGELGLASFGDGIDLGQFVACDVDLGLQGRSLAFELRYQALHLGGGDSPSLDCFLASFGLAANSGLFCCHLDRSGAIFGLVDRALGCCFSSSPSVRRGHFGFGNQASSVVLCGANDAVLGFFDGLLGTGHLGLGLKTNRFGIIAGLTADVGRVAVGLGPNSFGSRRSIELGAFDNIDGVLLGATLGCGGLGSGVVGNHRRLIASIGKGPVDALLGLGRFFGDLGRGAFCLEAVSVGLGGDVAGCFGALVGFGSNAYSG